MLILCWPALGKCRNGTISTFLSCWYYVEIMLRSCWPVPAPAALGKCKRGTISTFPSCWYYVDQCWRRLHWPKIKGGKILCSCWKFECVTCCVQNLGKNGVENFLQRHEKKLLEASTLGKIWVAASVLLAHYCLQACANNWVWNETAEIVALILGLNLLILLKMCDLLKNQLSWITALSLISWACVSGQKAKVGNGLGWPRQFSLSSVLPPLGLSSSQVLNPHPLGRWTWTTSLHTTTGDWRLVTSFIRSSAFVLVICLILFEEWVAKMV